MEQPKRKRPRHPGYDYSQPNAYFITICTKDKRSFFGPVGADSISARMIRRTFLETIDSFSYVTCPIFTVMPNHVHAIIQIERADIESAPTISEIIQAFKRYSTLEYIKLVKNGCVSPFKGKIWQRSFHDHVIRDEAGFLKIWNYIDGNPSKWEEDCFYVE